MKSKIDGAGSKGVGKSLEIPGKKRTKVTLSEFLLHVGYGGFGVELGIGIEHMNNQVARRKQPRGITDIHRR